MRNFKDFEIWEDAMTLVCDVYAVTKQLPQTEKFGLRSQMRRSAISIPSNIAEGSRGSNSELRHFIQIALGSSFELETQVLLSKKLDMIKEHDSSILLERLIILQKIISAFRNSLRS